MERADRAFHERVAAAFDRFATPAWQSRYPECGPIVAVNAAADADSVESRILGWLRDRLPALLPALTAAEVRA
jgi:dTMP kinase